MFNVGIDFGSTNSEVSTYRERGRRLYAVQIGVGSSSIIPSQVARDVRSDTLFVGVAARRYIGKKNYRFYKGFKMLLNEREDQTFLQNRGYSEEFTPRMAAECFLKDLVKKTLAKENEEKIDRLVIGAPEIWFDQVGTLSGRSILRDIFSRMENVGSVQVVSEPAAASAFFAYNYEQTYGKPFEGHILLIDYGGGTLDICLSKVSVERGADGRSFMEIHVADSKGAGENTDGQIGKAGIIYMEGLAEAAIRDAGLLEAEEPLEKDGAFYAAVQNLEDIIRDYTDEINKTFREFGVDDLEDLEQEKLPEHFDYKGEEVPVTYARMVEVYNNLISATFQEEMNKIIKYMKENHIIWDNPFCENLKIALVGGFGNFYLVRKQMERTFKIASEDKRTEGIIRTQSDCENAISLGTALLASEVIGIRHTAPYSVGIFYRDIKGRPQISYAIKYRQELQEDGKLWYHQREVREGNTVINKLTPFYISGNSIRNLIINRHKEDQGAIVLPLKQEFQRRLTNLVQNQDHTAVIAFSFDSSDILTIHVGEYDRGTETVGEMRPYELADFENTFDTAELIPVKDL